MPLYEYLVAMQTGAGTTVVADLSGLTRKERPPVAVYAQYPGNLDIRPEDTKDADADFLVF